MKTNKTSFAEDARRKNEIAMYGKVISLRPSIVHSTKKNYNRKDKSWKNEYLSKDKYSFAA